jgi:hypothetical protein
MSLHRLGIGFSAPFSHSAQRHCYVKTSALDQLLDTPGVLELLLEQLGGNTTPSSSVVEQLARLKRLVIHLSVTPSAFHGLSLEEIVVLCAYASERFDHTTWKRLLLEQPTADTLTGICRRWLGERAGAVAPGHTFGLPRWPLVGYTPRDQQTASRFIVGVAPVADATSLDYELAPLASEAGFGHEHYVACTPATALDYVRRAAHAGATLRWDPFALDRRLRSLGLGLLLVEQGHVAIYLPARYHPTPMGALTEAI